ncbi:energy-coupling factor ABC transporter ATP-binding protein [Methanocella arvoryzae]|uniref:ABC-type cobalt import system, ATPase component n=1 Tax=Methanocella arvoryzae (strain DSM 22066 / NBRC 105507 / MRE50) TaxID=351160 RepID=Q0W3S4_METAR|nr:ATP-binding cassette domain-containing protein [Methanocella arvoryzae]CAJ36969.1 putative ABC-type cobalt import system, ATPase component [Methanocella arvoryzae MRE50]
MIELRHVSLSYAGTEVLKDVSLEIRPGEIVALMGPNASGKSTLARILDGLLIPGSGECVVDGVSTKDDPLNARLQVGLVFQDPDDQVVSRRVSDDVAFGPLNIGAPDVEARVADALKTLGIEHLADRDIQTLSGGQKQLVAIAGVLAMRPAYIVLDEPTAMLDQDGTGLIMQAVAAAKSAGKGVLLITHDPDIMGAADRILVLKDGRIASYNAIAPTDADIELPGLARFWNRLGERGIKVDRPQLTVDGTVEVLCQLKPKA